MKLPRWTVYPALAVIATLIVTALPHVGEDSVHKGAAKRARDAAPESNPGGEMSAAEKAEIFRQERGKFNVDRPTEEPSSVGDN